MRARFVWTQFRPLSPSCLLAQCDSCRLLRFRSAVRSDCRVIIFLKFCSVSVVFLYNFSIVICRLFSLTSNSVTIVYVDHKRRILRPRVTRGHSALANDRPRNSGTSPAWLCVFGGLCVDMWRLVHQWSFFLLFDCFWLFLTIGTLWYSACAIPKLPWSVIYIQPKGRHYDIASTSLKLQNRSTWNFSTIFGQRKCIPRCSIVTS